MTVFWDKKCNHFKYYIHVHKTFISPAVLTSKLIRVCVFDVYLTFTWFGVPFHLLIY